LIKIYSIGLKKDGTNSSYIFHEKEGHPESSLISNMGWITSPVNTIYQSDLLPFSHLTHFTFEIEIFCYTDPCPIQIGLRGKNVTPN